MQLPNLKCVINELSILCRKLYEADGASYNDKQNEIYRKKSTTYGEVRTLVTMLKVKSIKKIKDLEIKLRKKKSDTYRLFFHNYLRRQSHQTKHLGAQFYIIFIFHSPLLKISLVFPGNT